MHTKSLPKLAVSKSKATEKLKDRIEKGERLLDLNILSDDELDSARHQFQNWEALNFDVLSQIFQDTSVADAYIQRLGAVLNASASLDTKTSWYEKEIKNSIHKLESIVERIDFLDENIPTRKSTGANEQQINKQQTQKNEFNPTINIHSVGNLIKDGGKNQKSWYEKWWGLLIIGVTIVILGALATNYLHLTTPK